MNLRVLVAAFADDVFHCVALGADEAPLLSLLVHRPCPRESDDLRFVVAAPAVHDQNDDNYVYHHLHVSGVHDNVDCRLGAEVALFDVSDDLGSRNTDVIVDSHIEVLNRGHAVDQTE